MASGLRRVSALTARVVLFIVDALEPLPLPAEYERAQSYQF